MRSVNLFLFATRRNFLRSGRIPSFLPIYMNGDKADFSDYRGISILLTMYKTLPKHPAVKGNSICRGSVNVDFEAADQLLIICCAFVKYLRDNGNTLKQSFSCL